MPKRIPPATPWCPKWSRARTCGMARRALRSEGAKAAVRWLEWAVIGPGAVAAAAAAAAIWLAVDKTKDLSPENKAVVTALVAATTTFLTTCFVEWTEDADGKMAAGWAERLFKTRFIGNLKVGSESQHAAHDDFMYGGWGHAARRKRAEVIDDRWARDRI